MCWKQLSWAESEEEIRAKLPNVLTCSARAHVSISSERDYLAKSMEGAAIAMSVVMVADR